MAWRRGWSRWVALVAVLWTAALDAAPARPGTDGELQRLARELEEREATLRDLVRQEKSVTRALGDLDESIAAMETQAVRLAARTTVTQQQVAQSELAAARLTRELEEREAALSGRLRAVMRLGPSADVTLLLGASSMRELLWTRHVLRRVAAEDAALVSQVTARRAALLAERNHLVDLQQTLARENSLLADARNAARATRDARAASLNALAMQKGAAQRRIDELQHNRRRLKDLLDELPVGHTATGFAARRGRLGWPTTGTVEVPYGPRVDPQSGVETLHSGVSIVAPLGQKVVAVSRGRVVHAGWLRGFGQLLILDHGEGFHSLLAHLSRITVQAGDDVAEGDVVAFVGDSESLAGPRLYFELRAKGRPVDPQKWLARP